MNSVLLTTYSASDEELIPQKIRNNKFKTYEIFFSTHIGKLTLEIVTNYYMIFIFMVPCIVLYIDKILQDATVCGYLFTAIVAYRPRWRKVVALIRDMTCIRSCSYSYLYSL